MNATAALLALSLLPAGPPERPALRELQDAVRAAIAKAESAVVCIRVSRSDNYRYFRQPGAADVPGQLGTFDAHEARRRASATNPTLLEVIDHKLDLANPATVPEFYGSGVIVDAAGLVLTNYHVVRDAAKIFVRLPDGRGSYADVHAADPRSDLAVLKLISLGQTPALPLGDGGKLRRGDIVLALANPYAVGFRDGQPSASWGVVSNVRRRVLGGTRDQDYRRPLATFGTLLQTDARLNLGCSGGALVNLDGELVGLTTAAGPFLGSDVAGGFAVPFDAAYRRIVEVLKAGHEVEYGFLGIQINPEHDIAVSGVTTGSPAARAGLRTGDVIRAVNGEPVREADDLFLHLGNTLAGNVAVLDVDGRNGTRRVSARLTKFWFPDPGAIIAAHRPGPERGLRVEYASVLLQAPGAKQSNIPAGVVVKDVQPGSDAERAGLKPLADVIISANGKPVFTPEEFYQAARAGGALELRFADRKPVTLP